MMVANGPYQIELLPSASLDKPLNTESLLSVDSKNMPWKSILCTSLGTEIFSNRCLSSFFRNTTWHPTAFAVDTRFSE
jgi:hypothetical protein